MKNIQVGDNLPGWNLSSSAKRSTLRKIVPGLAALRLITAGLSIMLVDPVFAEKPEHETKFEFFDGATGFAIQPEYITARPDRDGGAERRFGKEHVSKAGRAALLLEEGGHTITASSPKYKSVSGPLQVEKNFPYKIKFVLDPIERPQELRPEAVELLLRDDATLFQGFVGDEESGQPLSGVRVRSLPSGVETTTDARGFFRVYVPLQSQEQKMATPASLIWEKPGYRDLERQYLEVWPRGDTTYTIQLERGGGRKVIDQRTRHRNSTYNEDPKETNVTATAEMLAAFAKEDDLALTLQSTDPTNATVRVPLNIRVLEGDDTLWYVTFNYYQKNTLPSEWIRSWNTNSLNAGAVAIRGYAIDRFNNKAASSASDICGTSNCQNFDPGDTGTKTDKAVDYTEGYVMLNSSGGVEGLEYSSENNSMGKPCGDGFTDPNGGCLYDPICVGKTRSGHGRGMCQYGTSRWGSGANGFPVRDWRWMCLHYYPTCILVKGTVLVVGDDVKARTANDCEVHACANGGISDGVDCSLLAIMEPGTTGVILAGPTLVTSDGKGFTWYKVQWNDAGSTLGWSCENFIARSYSSPTAPTGLTATAVGKNQINLSWTDTSNVESDFMVERAPGTNGPWIQIVDLPANNTSYSDLNLYPASKWHYRVRAYNGNGYTSYTTVTNATTAGDPPTIAPVSDQTVSPGTLVTITNVGSVSDRAQLLTDFDIFMSQTANGVVLFRDPLNSSSTTNFLAKNPEMNIAALMDNNYPIGGQATRNVLEVLCEVTNATNPWLRLTTAGTAKLPNPVIDFTKKLQFDIYSDKSIKVAVGCRETTTAAGTAIGFDGGITGAIEWAGATNVLGTGPAPNRAISASNWTTLTFNFTNEPIRNFSGGNGVLSTASGLGVLEHLAIVPTAGINVYNIYLDNFAVLYSRTLTYSLKAGFPTGATIDANTGVFSWTPSAGQAPSTNLISVIATDNSVPALKATNTFTVYVSDASIVITNQPDNVITNVGSNVTFTVGASGTSLKYQWRFNVTNNLVNKTNASLTLTSVQITNIGDYSVIVSNASYSVTSSPPAVLTVIAPIIVSSSPLSRTNNIGDNAFFSVTATGTNLTYQWRFNGSDLSGQTASNLNLTVNSTTNAGNYSVVLSSPYATNVTNSATLSVPYDLLKVAQWTFNSQTPDANVTTGSLTPSTGSGSVTNIGGTTNRFAGGTTSDIASLGTDNSGWVSTNYPTTNANNKTAGVQFNVSTMGYQSLVITWEQYNDAQSSRYARLQYTTNGTTWIDGNVITNTIYGSFQFKSSDLSEVADIMNNTNFAVRIVTEFESTATGSGLAAYVPANPASTYSSNAVVRVDMFTVMGTIAPPVITSQPQSLTRTTGDSAVFTVAASGINLTYQWKKDGVDLSDGGNVSGSTTPSLTLASVNVVDAGGFSVAVSSGGGQHTMVSDTAVLTVLSGNRYWAANGLTYGGAGTWNVTSNRWGLSASGPFSFVWNNANEDIAFLGGTAGTVTMGTAVTANKLIFETGGYTIGGNSTLTFAGTDAGINNPGVTSNTSTTNKVTVDCPVAGPVFVKSGGGRIYLYNGGNTIERWIVKGGAISSEGQWKLFGNAPATLVTDYLTLDGGGMGYSTGGTGTDIHTNRGIYLGPNNGQLGLGGSSLTMNIFAPITGPGSLSFPGPTNWPGQIYGAAGTFILSNTNNNYQGSTTVEVGTLVLTNSEVLPDTTTLSVLSSVKLDLSAGYETVATVVVDGSGVLITNGTLSATTLFDLRQSGVITAGLSGTGNLTKTTANGVTLNGYNDYTGTSTLSAGTVTLNGISSFGNVGTLNLAGGSITLTQTRTTNSVLRNPVTMSADTTIQNGDTTTSSILFMHDGPWTTTGGILTVRNATSASGGLFDLVLANGFTFGQPIVVGLAGEKSCQLTSFNTNGLTQTYSGIISGTGTLRRSVVADGISIGGRTVLTVANTYTGPTTVDAGTLVVNNTTGSGTGTSNVTVTAVGQLTGTGTIAGNVVVSSGIVSAGDSVGILTLQNGLNLSSGGTNIWELGALADDVTGIAGTDFDQLVLTGGQLQLSGSSKLMLSFGGGTTPNDSDPFWRSNHTWKIINLSGASNLGNTTFASIVNGTYSCGIFTSEVDGSGNIILRFTTSISSALWWSANGSTLGGAGAWDTTNTRFGVTNVAPFNLIWNNAVTNSANFGGTGGPITVGVPITVNQINIKSSSYGFSGASTLTFTGSGAGMDIPGANNTSATNVVHMTNKLAGAVFTKTGGGRLNLYNTGTTVGKWVVNKGAITASSGTSADVLFGTGIPATLVTDFVTLDGGGLGFVSSGSLTVGANRGIYLGPGGGQIGNNNTAGIITINGPITGPGDLHFPGVTEWPGQVQGDNCTYIISNTNNNYGGWTRIATAEVRLGDHQVFPATTTLNITNGAINGRLNLNGKNQTVAKVILDSTTGSSRIFDSVGGGSLSAGQFELRRTASSTPGVSAVLAGSGFLTKTTTGNVTLSATNTYTGDTIISAGTLTIDAGGRFGSGAGVLNLAGGGIIQTNSRPEVNTLMNPALLSADSSIKNGDVGTGAVLFRHGGTWTATGGTLTIRNTTSTGAGSFDVVLTNGFTFTQPITNGVAGDKPCQLTSFNPSTAADQIFSGQISGIGSFRRSASTGSAGRTVFTSDNTYSGLTTVEAGTLVVNNPGPGSATGTNTVTVNTNGILSGAGTIGGTVVVNGGATISSGDTLGILTMQNGLTLTNAGTNVWDLTLPTDDINGVAGVDFDQLVLTGGQLQLGGSSKLLLRFSGSMASPDITNQFWRSSHNWTIVKLLGTATNPGNTKFTTIINPTNSAGYFSTTVSGGSVILSYKSYATNDLFWSGDSLSLGGIGMWHTNATSGKWANSADGPYNQAWSNTSGKGAIFDGIGGSVTIDTNITVKKMTVGVVGYSFDGTNRLTFSGTGAGVDYAFSAIGDNNKLDITCPLGGSLMTKTAAGRVHLTSTTNTVSKWAINGGIISVAGVSRFGTNPAVVVPDYITLNGGGIGFDGTTPTMETNRGVTLGTNGGKMGVRASNVTLTLQAPLTGPGGISFPGYSSFPTEIHGGGGTFVFNNTNNNYLGETAVSVGTLKLGVAGVLPNASTLNLTGSGKVDLNGFNETVKSVILNGSSAKVIGTGILTATNGFDVRKSGDVTAVLGGSSALTKTTVNTATLSGSNTYSGGTFVTEGTLLINNTNGTGTGTNLVTVSSPSGILGGSGIIGANVMVNLGGTISPGTNAVGTLTLTNGLNLTNGGNMTWELGALKDNVDGVFGVDFDKLAITGGQLRFGTDSTLTIQFTGTATPPDSTVPFWQVNHTWKVMVLSGNATNINNQTFSNLVYAVNDAGSFSNYVSGTNLMLTFLAGVLDPQAIVEAPPLQTSVKLLPGGTHGVQITWPAVTGVRYEVQYTSDLNNPNWQVLGEVIAQENSISATDFPPVDEPQRFYRLIAK